MVDYNWDIEMVWRIFMWQKYKNENSTFMSTRFSSKGAGSRPFRLFHGILYLNMLQNFNQHTQC